MKHKHIDISIILPLYNAGEYLRPCLDSILSQSFKSWELIIVCDCPTDGSDKIAQEYALQDQRIKVFYNTENQHIGISRNIGMAYAQGEYLCFMDHDDICHPLMLEDLYHHIVSNDAEVIFSEVAEGDTHPSLSNPCECRMEILSMLLAARNNYFNQIHGSLYKRELINTHHIEFVDTCAISGEDVLFNIEALYHSKNVALIPQSYYTHFNHTTSFGVNRRYFMPAMRKGMITHLMKVAAANNWTKDLYSLLDERIVRTYNHLFLRLIYWHQYSSFVNELRLAGKESYIREAYRIFSESSPKLHYTILFAIFRTYMRMKSLCR